ncbi:Tyrosinase [Smittium culicis]|uniref:Tyrosinase n=1 Tax=Smittium culicis TaxID=133412 RepID=A0A1R1XHY4_9FUNG|nr:Tyrosinase [Smittium culicis]
MKLSSSAVFVALAIAGSSNSQRCSNIKTRKEIRSLSSSEYNTYTSTLNQMYNLGWFNWFAFIHTRFFGPIHGTPQFLPWHRRFLLEFESLAQYYNPQYVQPYWDASIDFANPSRSVVLSGQYVGGDGRSGDRCITNGIQYGWINAIPDGACLRRNFENNGNISPYLSPEVLTSDIQTSANFAEYSYKLEGWYHNQVHNSIGFDMLSSYSPLDALFMLHHSNVDRLWWRFQSARSQNLLSYSQSTDERVTFYNNKVSDLLQVGYGFLCYQYADAPALRRRDDGSDPSDVAAVIETPEMNLATALSSDALKKYFPHLIDDSTNVNSVAMPNAVSTNAINYAKSRKNNINASPVAAASAPVVSDANIPIAAAIAIDDNLSLNSVSNPASNISIAPVNNNVADTIVAASNSNSVGVGAGANSGPSSDKPKMPYPSKVPESVLRMHNNDIDAYNLHYQQVIELVDLLNAQGYVSPYI